MFRASLQANSRLFSMPQEIFDMICKEWNDFPVADRVLLILVCKRFAQAITVRRKHIPRLPPSGNLAYAATATKRHRINFLQRLAPWFNDNTALNNLDILTVEESRKKGVWDNVFTLLPVDNGWILCVACLKYHRARTLMINLNDTPTKSDDTTLPGIWTRCVMGRCDDPRVLNNRESIDLTNIERDWLQLPATANAIIVPGYFNPKARLRKLTKKIDTPAGSSKGKAKEKVDTPENIKHANKSGKKGAEGKDPATWTGFEECSYLPVDVKGERVPVFMMCPMHTFDPTMFVGH